MALLDEGLLDWKGMVNISGILEIRMLYTFSFYLLYFRMEGVGSEL